MFNFLPSLETIKGAVVNLFTKDKQNTAETRSDVQSSTAPVIYNKYAPNIDPALARQLESRGATPAQISEEFKAPSTGEILKEETKSIARATKEFAVDQYKKTKESLPYIPEATKELVTKPKETANLAGKWWLGNAESLGESTVNTLNLFNSIAPTYGIEAIKKQKEKTSEIYKKTGELIKIDTSKMTPQEKIAVGGGKVTGEFEKYALMDGAIKALLAPLAKTKIAAKPELLQHIIKDASMKAEMSGLPEIAVQLKNLKTTGDVAKDIKAITEISAGAKNLGFKKMLLGSLSEAVSYSSKAMQVEALTDPVVAKNLYNITKELSQSAKIAANLGSFVAIGQIDHKPEDGARYEQALKDLAIGAAFEGAGILMKELSPLARQTFNDFKSGSKIALKDAEKLALELKANQRGFTIIPGITSKKKLSSDEVKNNFKEISDDITKKIVKQDFRDDKLNLPDEMLNDINLRLKTLGLTEREVKTFGDMKEAALELGATPEQLLKNVFNNRITSDEVVALKDLINTNKQYIQNLTKRMESSPEMAEVLEGQILNASAQIDKALQKLIKGGTEAGRAVVAYRIMARNTLDVSFWLRRAQKELGNRELTPEIQKIIFKLIDERNVDGLASIIANLRTPDLTEKAVTLWKAGLLTAPTTHLANISGNITMRTLLDASDIVAVPLDILSSVFTGRRTKTVGLDTLIGEVKGALKGTTEAGRFMRTGVYSNNILGKYDIPRQVKFDNPILDSYTKGVFRSLGAEDIVFRQIAMEKSLVEQAKVIAKNEGLIFGKADARVKELLQKPTNEMILNAIDTAEYATFQGENSLSNLISGAKGKLASKDTIGSKITLVGTEILAPFTKTPTNVAISITDFSPVGIVKGIVKGLIPSTRSQKALVEDLSKGITGTSVIGLGYWLASLGLIKGNIPDTQKERDTLYYQAQPNSILVNGYWRELNRVSPLGNLLVLGAEFQRLSQEKQGVDLYSATAAQGVKGLTEQTFLKGVSGGLAALTDPDRSAEKFAQQTVSSIIPSVITRIAKSIDPKLRQTDDIASALQERLPVLRESLAPRRDIFGNVVNVPSGKLYAIDPFSSKQDKSQEPIIKELNRLNNPIGLPSDTIDGVKLNTYEYSEFQKYNGKILEASLNTLVQAPEYQSLSDEDKKKAVDQLTTTIRDSIKDTVFPALMIVRYNLPEDTNPETLREILRQIDSNDNLKNKSEDGKATIIKKILMTTQ